jgi:hypothetical protein
MNKLKEALNSFQKQNNVAKKENKGLYNHMYANIDTIIQEVNKGAEFGLSFSQTLDYENVVVGDKLHTITFVRTILMHNECNNVIESKIPLTIKKENDSHAVGSAITYAKRYSLVSLYGLALDDDGNANSDPKPNNNNPFGGK